MGTVKKILVVMICLAGAYIVLLVGYYFISKTSAHNLEKQMDNIGIEVSNKCTTLSCVENELKQKGIHAIVQGDNPVNQTVVAVYESKVSIFFGNHSGYMSFYSPKEGRVEFKTRLRINGL